VCTLLCVCLVSLSVLCVSLIVSLVVALGESVCCVSVVVAVGVAW
jgi:hypothetical protein